MELILLLFMATLLFFIWAFLTGEGDVCLYLFQQEQRGSNGIPNPLGAFISDLSGKSISKFPRSCK
jgi:hypothetical protein